MKITRLSIAISLCLTFSGTCFAATTVAHGVIRFQGNIVDPSCKTNTNSQSRIVLSDCPHATRAIVVKAFSVVPSNTEAKVELISDTTQGRYYNQQYRLVDAAGSPIRSGMFVISMSLP